MTISLDRNDQENQKFKESSSTSGQVAIVVVNPDGSSISGGSGSSSSQVQGNVANDGIDAGNPVKIGGKANTAVPTAVANGDRVDAQFSKTGKQITATSLREMRGSQQTTITSSTAETTIVTANATYFLDLYGLILSNSSASSTTVTIKDATAGNTMAVFVVPATETRGFMLPPDSGLKQPTANNNWTATCGTSVASLNVTAFFVNNL